MTGEALDDLVTWLRAQLDEDERVALACQYRTWTRDGGSIHGGHEADPIVDWVYDEGGWEHIALHDPTSVLADIAAKRAILDLHWSTAGYVVDDDLNRVPALVCSTCSWRAEYGGERLDSRPCPCATLRLLASAYASRPGYREEWRP